YEDGSSAAARVRVAGPDFESSFRALCDAVQIACAAELEWQARVAVGLRAVLEFAASEPGRARALTVQARGGAGHAREDELLAYLAGRLAKSLPEQKRVPVSSVTGIVDSIATIVRGHLLAGSSEE